jgi:hypothetical protein
MKNLFLLPTDKPSVLIKDFNNKFLLTNGDIQSLRDGYQFKHIYITNDKEIKEGDWIYDISSLDYNPLIHKATNIDATHLSTKDSLHARGLICTARNLKGRYKKIILTTDQDLIKDGVQAINDTFLEWFVKNPSCEEVKIEDYGTLYNFRYLILIPQEEPKQETLEEFAEKLVPEASCELNNSEASYWQQGWIKGCIEGAKHQAERSYSEEEVGELVYTIIGQYANQVNIMIDGSIIDGLFEQFKKKA